MTRDELIKMAKEAFGAGHEVFWFDDYGIERFAALVASAEREEIVKEAKKKCWAMWNEDPFEDYVREIADSREKAWEDIGKTLKD